MTAMATDTDPPHDHRKAFEVLKAALAGRGLASSTLAPFPLYGAKGAEARPMPSIPLAKEDDPCRVAVAGPPPLRNGAYPLNIDKRDPNGQWREVCAIAVGIDNRPACLHGALRLRQRAKQHFPGWKIHYYFDPNAAHPVPPRWRMWLGGSNTKVADKDTRGFIHRPSGKKSGPRGAQLVRFLIAHNTRVDRFVVRDCDDMGALGARDKLAVDEWPVAVPRNTWLQRKRCVAQLRPGFSLSLRVLQNFDRLYSVDASKERQHNYSPGIAAAFLSEAFVACGGADARYLAAARALIEFDRACSWTGPFRRWPSKCKAAWGAANLTRALAVAAAIGPGGGEPAAASSPTRVRRSDSADAATSGGCCDEPPAKKAKTGGGGGGGGGGAEEDSQQQEHQEHEQAPGGPPPAPTRILSNDSNASHEANGRHDLGDGDPTPALTAQAEVAAHCRAVAAECFLGNQKPDGGFGPYHFPLADESVDNVAPGSCHWASGAAVPAESFAVGSELELTAEFVYELIIVAKGLLSVAPGM